MVTFNNNSDGDNNNYGSAAHGDCNSIYLSAHVFCILKKSLFFFLLGVAFPASGSVSIYPVVDYKNYNHDTKNLNIVHILRVPSPGTYPEEFFFFFFKSRSLKYKI